MAKQRNNIIEFARFLFSLLVVGYHIQMTWAGNKLTIFEGGALAVEFFFLLSGYFLAASIEKNSSKESYNLFKESGKFMWGKVKAILPIHIVAIIGIVIVILCTKLNDAGNMIVNGLPSVFLVHMAVVWDSSFNLALIVPEWYLSAMLVMMLFMFPIGLLLRKKLKGPIVTTILVGIVLVALVVCGFTTKWALPQNFVYDLRAWGEMCVGMFAYYLAKLLKKKELKPSCQKCLPILEIVLYAIPIIVGFVPFPADYTYITMIITVICIFFALSITFSNNGYQIKNCKVNQVFGFLGSISLAIYLFHPVYISLFEYLGVAMPLGLFYTSIYGLTLVSALLYKLVSTTIKNAILNRKNNLETTN